jgi:signal transduction histidine kinase
MPAGSRGRIVALALALAALLAVGLPRLAEREAIMAIEAGLRGEAAAFSPGAALPDGRSAAAADGAGAGGTRFILRRAGAEARRASDGWPASAPPPGDFALVAGAQGGTQALVTRDLGAGLLVLAARDVDATLAAARRLGWLGAGLGVAAVAAMAGGAILIDRRTERRVAAIKAALAAAGRGDLAARAPPDDAPDEVGALGRAINATLERLEALVAAMGEVSDRVAHELRTPLTRLRGNLARLAGAGEDERPALIESAAREAGDLSAMFGALLDIASAEARRADRTGLVPVSLAAIVADVVELYEPIAEERAIAIETRLDDGLEALGEAMLLTRLIANLVDNAIKFTPPRGRVSIGLERAGDGFRLTVEDTGPGLPEGFGERAFERFSRGKGAEGTPGHGLGLSLVRAIAVRHGFAVKLGGEVGRGLVVTISGPALQV